ncbi:MAG: hypothetical protein J6J24_00525 [Clostridia bacterium]|nr:hypothetical protein [Clostridia bacterium]
MPVCPKCKKQMRKKESLNFSYALQIAIDNAIRAAGCMPPKPTEWACVGTVPCKEYGEWQKKKEEYDKLMEERDKVIAQNERRLFKKKVPPMPAPLPPAPPKKIPCIEHWDLKSVRSGQFNVQIKKKRPKNFFLVDEITGIVSPKSKF